VFRLVYVFVLMYATHVSYLASPILLSIHLQFSVFDSNKLMRNELIGSFQFDASTVYLNTDHEFHRQVCMHTLRQGFSVHGRSLYERRHRMRGVAVLDTGDFCVVRTESAPMSFMRARGTP